jgi:hypothetical protein
VDCNNYLGCERKKYLEAEDAQTLVPYLNKKQMEDPSFFYSLQLDPEDGSIVNFFWTDGQAIIDYEYFGDVLSVDTTFQTKSLKCLSLQYWGLIITNKQSFLVLQCYLTKVLNHLFGYLKHF